ncbi:MAG TPA: flagellar basal body-associated FliL family protein, partial [Pseudohaliea sp.]|nr:flagellar basal body-associated FliL family protein [Pseudohaliea sp.]
IVVNLRGEGATSYLQAGIEVMARGEETIGAVQEHMPVVRNNLLLLLGSQTYKDIDDREGKERLRRRALEEVNKVLAEQGIEEQVEAVYFTSFVLQ